MAAYKKEPITFNLKKKYMRTFLKDTVYPKQFENKIDKFTFSLVRLLETAAPGKVSIEEYCKLVQRGYIGEINSTKIPNVVKKALGKVDRMKDFGIRIDNFTFIRDIIEKEDLQFLQGNQKRIITYKEIQHLLRGITWKILNHSEHSPILTNRWFMNPNSRKSYFKYTGRKLSVNKLSYVVKLLNKYKLLYVENNGDKGCRKAKIGPTNPYYLCEEIPDLTDRELEILNNPCKLQEEKQKEPQSIIQEQQKEIDRLRLELEYRELGDR